MEIPLFIRRNEKTGCIVFNDPKAHFCEEIWGCSKKGSSVSTVEKTSPIRDKLSKKQSATRHNTKKSVSL